MRHDGPLAAVIENPTLHGGRRGVNRPYLSTDVRVMSVGDTTS